MQKKKGLWIALGVLLIAIIIAVAVVYDKNEYYLELSVPEETITLEYGVDEIPEITALCKGTIINKKGSAVETTMVGAFDPQKLGAYEVVFEATYKNQTISEKRTIIIEDTIAPTIELVSDPEHFTSPVASYEEEGFTALDNYDGNITEGVIREEKDGIVTYTVTDSSGNMTTVTRTIVYKDVVAPSIELEGGNDTVFNVGSNYKDPGYKATDDVDGDITKNVTVTGSVDGNKEGTYTLTYNVADSSGNTFEIQRKVVVKDAEKPVIKLSGDKSMTIKVDSEYKEPGFKATDNKDGDITDKVTVSGSVNTSKTGSYTITYKVSDAAGNTTTVKRTVSVFVKQAESATKNPGNKVVYLTFDDGPSKYTAQLLNILDKYGVKATFFVTNQFPKYQYMIKETYERGHTIALHTYTHDYSKVYASVDAYFADLQKIQDVVVKQTGKEASIVRFPGGTSNSVSRKYTKGIMTYLANNMANYGYLYCDWNVSSGDAGGTKTVDGVYKNVIKGMKNNNVSVVLQHDITNYSVQAVDKIIAWGLANGYTFLPMDDSTPMVHHKPNN